MTELLLTFFWANVLASLTALLLLAVKWLAREHMTARWHLRLWLLLFWQLAALPLVFGGSIQGSTNLWRALRLPQAQQALTPVLQAAAGGATAQTPVLYAANHMGFPAPILPLTGLEPPGSLRLEGFCRAAVWVWLGVAALLLAWFGALALRQARTVKHYAPADEALVGRVHALVERFLPEENWVNQPDSFRVAVGPNGPSPYVCRALGPVLVVPAGQDPDDRVLLHELCHLARGDLGKNSVVLLFRCLYWCNPLLWWVLGRVSDDLEAACDERVLQLLTPQEQLDYGRLLLDLAVPHFRRRMATSCIASGPRQIRARITRTARYCEITGFARGMGVLAALVLFVLTGLMPRAAADAAPGWQVPRTFGTVQAAQLRALRPASPIQALWLYGMGEATDCGYYRYPCADQALRRALWAQFEQNAQQGRDNPWHFDSQILDLAAREALPFYAGSLVPDPSADLWQQTIRQLADTPEWYLGQDVQPVTSSFAVVDLVREGGQYTAAVTYTVQFRDPVTGLEDDYRFYTDLVTLSKEQGRWVVRRTQRQLNQGIWPFHEHKVNTPLLRLLHLHPSMAENLNPEYAPVELPRRAGIRLLAGTARVDLTTGRLQSTQGFPADLAEGKCIYGPQPKEVTRHA